MSIIGTTSLASLTNEAVAARAERIEKFGAHIYGANKRRVLRDWSSKYGMALSEISTVQSEKLMSTYDALHEQLTDDEWSEIVKPYIHGGQAQNFLPGMNLILGHSGQGKSRLAADLARQIAEKSVQGLEVRQLFVGEAASNYPAITSIESWATDLIQEFGSLAADDLRHVLVIDSISTLLTATELANASALQGGESSALISSLIDLNNAFLGSEIVVIATINFHDFTRLPDLPGAIASSWVISDDGNLQPLHWRAPANPEPNSFFDIRLVDAEIEQAFSAQLALSVAGSNGNHVQAKPERPAIESVINHLNLI